VSDTIQQQDDLSSRTVAAGREVLAGQRRGARSALPFIGPAVIASVAYMDPGNFATNIQAGARYGYLLLWVVVAASLVAMLFQGMSAKLGIVTGHSLAELCRIHLPRRVTIAMWLASEVAAMATDLAEFLGGAIGLSLLLGLPLMVGLVITGVLTYGLLLLGGQGFRPLELTIALLVGVIGLSYLAELLIAPLNWGAFAVGAVVPRLDGAESLTLAVGIVGATVMPHAIYLHSNLTRNRVPTTDEQQVRRVVKFSWREVKVALGLAGLINMAMMAMAAAAFHAGHADVAEIETAYRTLGPLLGGAAAGVFMVSLLASGLSSSVVGTMAGQHIMQDFTDYRLPIWLRRLVTMIPAFVVVALGANATRALVLSQVVLSLVLPLPMVALLWLSSRRDVMGRFASSGAVRAAAIAAAATVLALNAVLLLQIFGMPIPGLG